MKKKKKVRKDGWREKCPGHNHWQHHGRGVVHLALLGLTEKGWVREWGKEQKTDTWTISWELPFAHVSLSLVPSMSKSRDLNPRINLHKNVKISRSRQIVKTQWQTPLLASGPGNTPVISCGCLVPLIWGDDKANHLCGILSRNPWTQAPQKHQTNWQAASQYLASAAQNSQTHKNQEKTETPSSWKHCRGHDNVTQCGSQRGSWDREGRGHWWNQCEMWSLWVVLCWHGFLSCNKATTMMQHVSTGEAGWEVHGNSLYHLFNFAVNWKRFQNKIHKYGFRRTQSQHSGWPRRECSEEMSGSPGLGLNHHKIYPTFPQELSFRPPPTLAPAGSSFLGRKE